ncbi:MULTISPECIES: DUF2513 domain-containing protein [unclassified Agrobacterium]|uniref:DUF2513 domain-containing protein n=1 Tax=unclassified Agrobacterium TaxID=2632611 RepID=UPI00055726B8|nr:MULTISPECIES: DUF2513 domain-containing protein [unclassified Agrobacterium]QKW95812.1 DUF2513 domain-containing protein [Agrobacterium sp. CGMCC 11546]
MKRDMGLIRELMLKLESLDFPLNAVLSLSGDDKEVAIDGFSADQISYHLIQIREAGFLQDTKHGGMRGGISFKGFSWEGHDFLDSIRDPDVWEKTQTTMKKAGGFTFDLVKAMAKGFLKKKIEQLTDVEIDI